MTRRGTAEPITWRGVELEPHPATGFYRSASSKLSELRAGDWALERVGESWHGRLRIGRDRFVGVGDTPEAALDAAAGEARRVASFIRRMLPPGARGVVPTPAGKRSKAGAVTP